MLAFWRLHAVYCKVEYDATGFGVLLWQEVYCTVTSSLKYTKMASIRGHWNAVDGTTAENCRVTSARRAQRIGAANPACYVGMRVVGFHRQLQGDDIEGFHVSLLSRWLVQATSTCFILFVHAHLLVRASYSPSLHLEGT